MEALGHGRFKDDVDCAILLHVEVSQGERELTQGRQSVAGPEDGRQEKLLDRLLLFACHEANFGSPPQDLESSQP